MLCYTCHQEHDSTFKNCTACREKKKIAKSKLSPSTKAKTNAAKAEYNRQKRLDPAYREKEKIATKRRRNPAKKESEH